MWLRCVWTQRLKCWQVGGIHWDRMDFVQISLLKLLLKTFLKGIFSVKKQIGTFDDSINFLTNLKLGCARIKKVSKGFLEIELFTNKEINATSHKIVLILFEGCAFWATYCNWTWSSWTIKSVLSNCPSMGFWLQKMFWSNASTSIYFF